MGGRGTFASGNMVPQRYETVDRVGDIKVLEGRGGAHGLPEESHSPSARYMQRDRDGSTRAIRVYDEDRYLRLEVARHQERALDPSGVSVMHYHTYGRDFSRSEARPLTPELREEFGRYFEGA